MRLLIATQVMLLQSRIALPGCYLFVCFLRVSGYSVVMSHMHTCTLHGPTLLISYWLAA